LSTQLISPPALVLLNAVCSDVHGLARLQLLALSPVVATQLRPICACAPGTDRQAASTRPALHDKAKVFISSLPVRRHRIKPSGFCCRRTCAPKLSAGEDGATRA